MKHIEHVEDLLFTVPHGFLKTIEILNEVNDFVFNRTSLAEISVKYDGAPAIVFGINPDNGRFFVSTKSAWNIVKPILNYDIDDIKNNHKSEDLQSKLILCLENLPKVLDFNCDLVFQADYLFDQDSITFENNHVCFQPNLIKYKTWLTGMTGQGIKTSKIGLCVHTAFRGNTFRELRPVHIYESFDQYFYRSSDVFLQPPWLRFYRGQPEISYDSISNQLKIIEQLSQTRKLHTDYFCDKLNDKVLKKNLNQMIVAQQEFDGNDTFHWAYRWIQHIKNDLIRCLDSTYRVDHPFSCFIGGNQTGPEGYVVKYSNDGTIVKFVNRDNFSRLNQLYGKFRAAA